MDNEAEDDLSFLNQINDNGYTRRFSDSFSTSARSQNAAENCVPFTSNFDYAETQFSSHNTSQPTTTRRQTESGFHNNAEGYGILNHF